MHLLIRHLLITFWDICSARSEHRLIKLRTFAHQILDISYPAVKSESWTLYGFNFHAVTTPTKTAHTANINLGCFVIMQFCRKFTHFSGVRFTGQKMRWRTKNDKYQVCATATSISNYHSRCICQTD